MGRRARLLDPTSLTRTIAALPQKKANPTPFFASQKLPESNPAAFCVSKEFCSRIHL
jgi:hypothetical protein